MQWTSEVNASDRHEWTAIGRPCPTETMAYVRGPCYVYSQLSKYMIQ